MSGPGEIESVLARFHQWLAAARADAANSATSVLKPEAEHDSRRPFGLIDLVEEFTALRQELKLQTKSTRGLQEQAESLLPPLRQAIEHFRSVDTPGRTGGMVCRQANRRGTGDPRRGARSLPRRDREGPRLSGSSRPPASSLKPSTGCTRACPGSAASSCGGTTGR